MLTPTTALEAVNRMLRIIQEAPVNTLETTNVDALDAHATLLEVSRELQSPGWNFNREYGYLLPSDLNGEVFLPQNTLSVDSDGQDTSRGLVQRGRRLYDPINHTFNIGKDVKVDITFLLPFDELPETARRLITIRAARAFQASAVGSQTLAAFTQEQEQSAQAAFHRAMLDTGDFNILDNSLVAAMRHRRNARVN